MDRQCDSTAIKTLYHAISLGNQLVSDPLLDASPTVSQTSPQLIDIPHRTVQNPDWSLCC